MEYRPTIGLEIHAELKTKTKLFCNSKNDPDEKKANVNVCPICMGHPGTLPVLNREAVKHVLKVGLALGGVIADFTEFDRKNYFYPDLPKGYQISQYKYPLVVGGNLRSVAITRIHLEEDTARSQHTGEGSLVDFNRAGVPLMELVTEPVIGSGKDAAAFAKELQLLLRALGAGEANMEKGEMRVEANVSVSAGEGLGTKVEVKNINSFRAVERAVAYEIERQEKLLRKGERVVQETRGWNEGKQQTISQRLKEESHDYRYFPEPDLPKLKISEIPEFGEATLRKETPELPSERRERYRRDFGIKGEDIEVLMQDPRLGGIFEAALKLLPQGGEHARLAANYLTSDVIGYLRTQIKDREEALSRLTAAAFAELIDMVEKGEISSRGAKDLLGVVLSHGGGPRVLATQAGLLQKSGEKDLQISVSEILKENPGALKEYQQGSKNILEYLLGQAMKRTKGSANPQVLRKLLEAELGRKE